jgi:phosphohistidine swiveling domain-containing protein
MAYIWYSIAAALNLEGAMIARDDARDNLADENIIELQAKAGTIYEGLTFNLD